MIFEKNRNFLEKSVNIRRLCTGKRDVFCKKHYNLCFFRETSVLLKKATQRTRSKKKSTPWCVCVCVCVFFALRALPAPSLTHSLACRWLLGGNSNLKQNLSFIKEGFIEENRKHAKQKNRKKDAEQKNTRSKKKHSFRLGFRVKGGSRTEPGLTTSHPPYW